MTIKEFSDLDYGIDIPHKGDVLSGSRADEVKTDTKLEAVDTKEVVDKGKGKLKINSQYLTPQNLSVEKKKKSRKIYELKKSDTLWDIAVEHYGAAKQ